MDSTAGELGSGATSPENAGSLIHEFAFLVTLVVPADPARVEIIGRWTTFANAA